MDIMLLILVVIGLAQLYLLYRLLVVVMEFKNERLEVRRIIEQEKWV